MGLFSNLRVRGRKPAGGNPTDAETAAMDEFGIKSDEDNRQDTVPSDHMGPSVVRRAASSLLVTNCDGLDPGASFVSLQASDVSVV